MLLSFKYIKTSVPWTFQTNSPLNLSRTSLSRTFLEMIFPISLFRNFDEYTVCVNAIYICFLFFRILIFELHDRILVWTKQDNRNKKCSSKGEKCSGRKRSTVRKLQEWRRRGRRRVPLVNIFRCSLSKGPRCFKNVKILPCRYKSQKKSWMGSEIFEEWFVNSITDFVLKI